MIDIGVLPIMEMSDFKRSKEFIIRHNTPLQQSIQLCILDTHWQKLTLNLLLNFPTSRAAKYRSMLLFSISIYFGTGP